MPSMDQWVCDICKVKKFKTFEEACRHEEDCRKQQQQPDTEAPMNETSVNPEEDAPELSAEGAGAEEETTPLSGEQGDEQGQVEDSRSSGSKRKRKASIPAPANKRQLELNASPAAVSTMSEKQNEVNNNRGRGRDQAEEFTSSARERKTPPTPASTNVVSPASSSSAAASTTFGKRNELNNNQGKEREQAEESTSFACEWEKSATPASTNIGPKANASHAAVSTTFGKRNEVNNNQGKEREQAEESTSFACEWENPATPASTNVSPPAAVTPERRRNNSNKSHNTDRNRSATDSQVVPLSGDQAKYLERLKARNPIRDQKGSGSWALLRVFHEHVQSHDNDSEVDNAAITKAELIKKAADYCLKVMEYTVISDRGSATQSVGEWRSMKTLERKGLVQRENKGSKGHFFWLTTQGKAFCQKLFSSTSSSSGTQSGAKNTEQSTPSPKKTMLHYFAKK